MLTFSDEGKGNTWNVRLTVTHKTIVDGSCYVKDNTHEVKSTDVDVLSSTYDRGYHIPWSCKWPLLFFESAWEIIQNKCKHA